MDFGTLLSFTSSSATSVPAVSSRPFTAAFFITFLGRMVYEARNAATAQAQMFGYNELAAIEGMNLPLWLISEVIIFGLAFLMAAEWYSDYDENFRVMLEDAKTNLVKPGVGAMLQFGFVQGQGATVLDLMATHLPSETMAWLISISPGVAVASVGAVDAAPQAMALGWLVNVVAAIWAVIMAGFTWLAAGFRQGVVDLLTDLDEDDSFGLMKVVSLAEGGWTITLMVVLFSAPFIALGLAGLTMLGLFLVRKYFERRDERSKVGCASCGTPIYPTAMFCQSCRQPVEAPRQVGLFGQAKAAVAVDRTNHHLQLLARKRCPFCATRLPAKTASQSCPACGTVTFADIGEANRYLRALDAKLPMTLVVCGVLGAVPVVGVIPAIIYYRLSLIASLRAYIPQTAGCLTRWGLRFASIFLVALQPFFLGWLTIPAMALLNFLVYRQVLSAGFRRLAPAPAVAAAPFGGAVALAGGPAVNLAVAAPPPAVSPQPIVPTASPATLQRACASCGAENPAGYRFCANCGSAITPSAG